MWNVQIGDVTEIDLECTTFCNLKCPECNRTTDKDVISSILNTSHITLENCRTWFKPTELTSLKEIRFCGAIDEALMNPELTDILDFFLDEFKIKYIDIRTNGSVRSTEWWSNFVNHLPSNHIIVFGLDGLEDTNHIYRVGAKWEKIINNAKAFIDAGGIASWQFIEFEHNKHQIEEAKQLAKELGFKEFRLVSSTRPTMTESLEHIRKDNKVSARSNRVPEKKEVILSDKKESEEETMVPCSTSKPKKPVQELVLIRKKTKKQKTVIRCENQGHGNGNRILVNALSQVVPCCFLNGYFHQPYAHNKNPENITKPAFSFYEDPRLAKLLREYGDSENELTAMSLEHHTLKEVLAGEFFAEIQDSWTTNDPIERCLEVCGKAIKDEINEEFFE
jgi:molybdenum cofactor biosynthesis enzyme MoaA